MRRIRCKNYYFYCCRCWNCRFNLFGWLINWKICGTGAYTQSIHTHTGLRLKDSYTHTQYALVDSHKISKPHVERAHKWCRTMSNVHCALCAGQRKRVRAKHFNFTCSHEFPCSFVESCCCRCRHFIFTNFTPKTNENQKEEKKTVAFVIG